MGSTSKNSSINLTSESNGVFTLFMADAGSKNALTPEFVESLVECLHSIKLNDAIKVLVLKGLPEVFCSGADMDTLVKLCKRQLKPVDIILSKMMLDIPIPVISAMEGHAIGGGLALGLCADVAVLAEESRYGCSFMNMGFTPGMGITKLMEHYMSPAIAQEMQYTGKFYQGRDLIGKTNFNYILPKEDVLEKANALAESMAEKPRKALAVLKRYQSMQRRKLFEETYSIETMMHELTFNEDEILKIIKENYVR
ncbi:polyketide synthase [Aurantibacillus circumpalustris]|uniref:polyketide synthase n=1 Tax=Aurantibacillus circumpalustris TaxID=3036359 RepID=UPI00295AE396|nr:polyketide synthase [Aurantibacillus circumpalustris]